MSIADDLAAAQREGQKMVAIEIAVRDLAKTASISNTEAAKWLLLKAADSQMTAYLFDPISSRVQELPLKSDHLGTMHYIAVREKLAIIAELNLGDYPFAESHKSIHGYRTTYAAWNTEDLQAFLARNRINSIESQPVQAAVVSDGDDTPIAEQRKKMILAHIAENGWEPQEIPINGKTTLREKLCTSANPLFTASTFDKAWSHLSASNAISIIGKERYKKRKPFDSK